MSKKDRPGPPETGDQPIRILERAAIATDTIDLGSLSEDTLSPSGSFDLTGVQTSSFGKLLQSLPIPALLIDRQRTIIFANQAFSTIDRDYKQIHGNPFSSLLVNVSGGKEVLSVLERVFSSRKPEAYTAMIQIGDHRIWGRMNFRPLRMKEYRSILVLVEDLTLEKNELLLTQKHQQELRKEIIERKRTEDALRKSEEKYRNIIATIEDGYYEVDVAGNLTFFNDNLCKITGYPRQELENLSYQLLTNRENSSKTLEEFRKVYATGEPTKVFDHEIVRKDGTKRSLAISISLMRDASGRPSGFRGICRDITERKRAAEDRVRIEKLESIGILSGRIAHDFNNILAAILGNISLARVPEQSPDKIARRLGEAEKAVGRAQELTQQLLTFSKGGWPIRKTASISELVRGSCEFAARGSNVRCEFSAPEDIYPVEIDAGQVNQVINILILNAVQAMPDGGVIHVRLENISVSPEDGLALKNGNFVKLSIQDHGVGIPAHVLPKIFDPYFTTKEKGSGVGLSTAYSIIKSHGGLITVDSEPGVGTTFHIFFPVSHKARIEHRGTDAGLVSGTGKILLMDDEDAIREMTREMLSMLGYEIDVAKDGEEAIGLYRSAKDSGSPYSAVILDLTVPGGMGGKETLHDLLQIDPNVRAIVSSGYSNDPIMSNYESYGFSGVVVKPYSGEELSQTIQTVISKD